jgi:putative YphP/YqiW family bacilliredoxin
MLEINTRGPVYDPEAVQPMRDELLAVGFSEMLTPSDVHQALDRKDDRTVLLMINSVCGCAAGSARPGVMLALQNPIIPDVLVTSFAGQDRDAVDEIRQKYLSEFPPSSPFIALLKKGEVIFAMPRYNIEGKTAEMVAQELVQAFNQFCSARGPSIPPERFAEIQHAVICGSKIPLAK